MTTRDVNYNFGNLNYTIKSPNISGVGTFDLQPRRLGSTESHYANTMADLTVDRYGNKISGVGTPYKSPYPDTVTVRMPQVDDLNLDSLHRYIVRDDYGNVVVDVPAKDTNPEKARKIQTPDAVSKKSAAMHTYYNQTKPIAYKYNESETLKDITAYVNKTYGEHYSQNKFQATEFIIDSGHGEGFCIGNMLKYTQRYGRKGEPTEWRKDLMKVIHYAIMMLHVHDEQHKKKD